MSAHELYVRLRKEDPRIRKMIVTILEVVLGETFDPSRSVISDIIRDVTFILESDLEDPYGEQDFLEADKRLREVIERIKTGTNRPSTGCCSQ